MHVYTVLLLTVPVCLASRLPIVDLGYELHQASSYSEYATAYNFSNIRYAAPPVGDLRFRGPVPPAKNRSHVQTGTHQARRCPQASPIWQDDIATPFLKSYFRGQTFTHSSNISSYSYQPEPVKPGVTEDCLFLDVLAPKQAFEHGREREHGPGRGRGNGEKNPRPAPVLVWIYGGGYTSGDKSMFDAKGLVRRSRKHGEEVVYVALNYRLGAFGWLAGDSLTANGTANAALHDQRLALKWVQRNIHLFGGDPQRVTVMGESAGGGSIMHQITAYGGSNNSSRGKDASPFQQAILQSPGWEPLPAEDEQEATLRQFLGLLNVSSVEEARRLPSEKLIAGNAYQVATSRYGSYTYGPVVDGTFVPELPGKLLLEGRFDKTLNLMLGHNANEGLVFTPPASNNSKAYERLVRGHFPGIKQSVLDHVANMLYPPVYNGSHGYVNPIQRFALTVADVVFQCNTDYLNRAFRGRSFAYMFDIPPALHGEDVSYTFYDPAPGANASSSSSTRSSMSKEVVAFALQDYITSFVQSGHPRAAVGPVFSRHGENNTLQRLGPINVTAVRDPTANARCRFWQTAPYA